MACVSFVPPGTLNPPPAQTPKSQGWASSGLEDWASATPLIRNTKNNPPPRRHGDTENSNRQRALKFIHSPVNTREYQVRGTNPKQAAQNPLPDSLSPS